MDLPCFFVNVEIFFSCISWSSVFKCIFPSHLDVLQISLLASAPTLGPFFSFLLSSGESFVLFSLFLYFLFSFLTTCHNTQVGFRFQISTPIVPFQACQFEISIYYYYYYYYYILLYFSLSLWVSFDTFPRLLRMYFCALISTFISSIMI